MTRKLDRFLIDDGRHLAQIVLDEDASHAEGQAVHRVTCSCGYMPAARSTSRDVAYDAFLAHVSTRLDPPKGPPWLPLGVRITILATLMLAVCLTGHVAGQALPGALSLTGVAAQAFTVACVLLGIGLSMVAMVASRRYIAPTRA